MRYMCACTVFLNASEKHSGIWINWCRNDLFWFLIANYYNYLFFFVCVFFYYYTSSWIFPEGTEVLGSLNWQLWKFLRNYLWKKQSSPVMFKGNTHIPEGWEEHWWMWENEYPDFTSAPAWVLKVVFVAFTFLQLWVMGVLQMCPV